MKRKYSTGYTRAEEGLRIAQPGSGYRIERVDRLAWRIRNPHGEWYEIDWLDEGGDPRIAVCSCPDSTVRNEVCKHVYAAQAKGLQLERPRKDYDYRSFGRRGYLEREMINGLGID